MAHACSVSAGCSSGDPYNETNWGWFEDQTKVKTGIRLRFGLGGTDDLDGLEENHDPFVEVRRTDWDSSILNPHTAVSRTILLLIDRTCTVHAHPAVALSPTFPY